MGLQAVTMLLAKANPVLPDLTELIVGTLSFLVMFVLLWRTVFPNIKKAMDERSERIFQWTSHQVSEPCREAGCTCAGGASSNVARAECFLESQRSPKEATSEEVSKGKPKTAE